MKKAELEHFKQALLDLQSRCDRDVNQLTDEALRKSRQEASGDLSSVPIHMADMGTDNFEQEFTLSLLENEEEVLGEISDALARINAGNFGQCEDCKADVPRERLKAIPYTRYCVACARKLEK